MYIFKCDYACVSKWFLFNNSSNIKPKVLDRDYLIL